ncbi:hypothetical protein [Blastopirellula marina]|uniref:Uncharacterized protein n=1 Tax=Blastopirellula marina DSM 3645 TaxID=314230 RepID=A3ZLE6_9BACT|nr:hypothetical protein [Blastopirellula marina]EAQ82579.1 hypothetical protein DSM3645_09277 [Blastopirellula marina DSM 3645]
MFVILLGVLCLFLGLRGFSKAGLPITHNRSVSGIPDKLIAVFCCLLGGVLIAFVFYANLSAAREATWMIEEIEHR